MSSFLDDPNFMEAVDELEDLGADAQGPYIQGRYLAGLLRKAFSSEGGVTPKNNLNATTNPSKTDDSDDGYALGSFWLNTGKHAFICTDPTAGAAIWNLITPSRETVNLLKKGAGATPTDIIQYDTIAAATADAVPGDAILLGSGTYVENVSLPDGVSLEGEGDANGGTFLLSLGGSTPLLTCAGNHTVCGISLFFLPIGGPTNMIEITGTGGVTLKGMTIPPSIPGKNAIGFSGAASGRLTLVDCTLTGQPSAAAGVGIKFDIPGFLFMSRVQFSSPTSLTQLDVSGGCIVRGNNLSHTGAGTGPTAATFLKCADASCFFDYLTIQDINTVFDLTHASSKVNVSSTFLDSTSTNHLAAPIAGSSFQFLGGQLDVSKISHISSAKILILGGNVEAGKEGEVTYASSGLVGAMSEFQVDGVVVFSIDKAGKLLYSPGTPGDWVATAPTNIQDAMDRMATQIAILLSGPIP